MKKYQFILIMVFSSLIYLSCIRPATDYRATISLYQSVIKDESLIDSIWGTTIIKRGKVYSLYFNPEELSYLFFKEPTFDKISFSFLGFNLDHDENFSFHEFDYWRERYSGFVNLSDSSVRQAILEKAYNAILIHNTLGLRYVQSTQSGLRFHINSQAFFLYEKSALLECKGECISMKPNWCYCDGTKKPKDLIKIKEKITQHLLKGK